MIHSSSLPNWDIKRVVPKERASSFVHAKVMWRSTEIVDGLDGLLYLCYCSWLFPAWSVTPSSVREIHPQNISVNTVCETLLLSVQYIVFLLILYFVNHVLASNTVFTVGMKNMVWSEIVISSACFVHGFCVCMSVCLSVYLIVSL